MVLIYIYFVELFFVMLYAKFQNHRPSGSRKDFEKTLLFITKAAILVM